MKKINALLIILYAVLALPLTISAESRTYKPPAKKGIVYVAVKFKSYSSRDITSKTKVKITWGNFQNEKTYGTGFIRLNGTSGVIIKLLHNNNDSVPLTVETDGSIVSIEQDKRPNVINFKEENW